MRTTVKGVQYPDSTDNVSSYPAVAAEVATWLDTHPGTEIMNTATRNALAGANLWVGKLIYNTDLERIEMFTAESAWKSTVALMAYTTAIRNTLTGNDLWVGRMIRNTTTQEVEIWDGTEWRNLLPITNKGDLAVGIGSFLAGALPVGTDGQRLTARSSSQYGIDWESAPAQQVFVLGQHVVNAGATYTGMTTGIVIPTAGAGTWGVRCRVSVSSNNPNVAGASLELFRNGTLIQKVFPSLQPSPTNGYLDLSLDMAGLAVGDNLTLQYLNTGTNTLTFVSGTTGQQGDGGTDWFTATWLHG